MVAQQQSHNRHFFNMRYLAILLAEFLRELFVFPHNAWSVLTVYIDCKKFLFWLVGASAKRR